MTNIILDDTLRDILKKYAGEVREEKRMVAINAAAYDSAGFEMRICILSAIKAVG